MVVNHVDHPGWLAMMAFTVKKLRRPLTGGVVVYTEEAV